MHEFVRDPFPKRIVWRQDNVTHKRFYWLAVDGENEKVDAEIRADLDGQTIEIKTSDVNLLAVRLNDEMLDMDKPVTVRANGRTHFGGPVRRTIAELAKTLAERGDPKSLYCGEVGIRIAE